MTKVYWCMACQCENTDQFNTGTTGWEKPNGTESHWNARSIDNRRCDSQLFDWVQTHQQCFWYGTETIKDTKTVSV